VRVRHNVMPLVEMLAERHGPQRAREILSVWAGLKCARLRVAPVELTSLTQIVEALGLAWRRSGRKYLRKRDVGKGGWSNKFDGSVSRDSPRGDWLLYVARDGATAEAARAAEEQNRESDFASYLSIPACCAKFHLKFLDAAYAKQNDYVPFVLDQTAGAPPYNFLLNYVTRYFGYALISFFPCSFQCRAAANVAQRTLQLLKRHAPRLAAETVRLQKCSVLYTEYRGLYLFEKGVWDWHIRALRYDPKAIRGTLPLDSAVFRKLRAGRMLEVESKHAAVIRRGGRALAALRGENVSICIF
jgi:hypothetical protein